MQSANLMFRAFMDEPPGHFALGHVFGLVAIPGDFGPDWAGGGVGWWECDLTKNEELAWSDEVYQMFGLPEAVPVTRQQAVGLYQEHSRSVLERVRAHAINRESGFILDAEIGAPVGRWIRVFATPVHRGGRVGALRGLKRRL